MEAKSCKIDPERGSVNEQSRREEGMRRAIADARRNMLDLTRRNRLLHAPLTGKRPWCLAIDDAEIDKVFGALVRGENANFAFAPRALGEDEEGEARSEEDTAPGSDALRNSVAGTAAQQRPRLPSPTEGVVATDLAVRANKVAKRPRNRGVLQTRLTPDKLEKRVTKIYRDARTLEEEQGLSTLFLAIGFLRWFDSDQSQEASTAPLILVPVVLDRVSDADKYVLASRDDDLVANISLREKLRNDFGVTLPELPEGDDWLPSHYLAAVQEAIGRQRRWGVDAAAVGVGFFTFSKFLMWKDLDPNTWPGQKLLSHPLLKGFLGGDVLVDGAPALVSDEEPIDRKIDLSSAVHVVDADSSQAVVIEEARQGRSLVVQGPPGTGKSQTITNIIASAVNAGKSVLFVAEKTTALGVVHKRLKQAGLDALCLEMHSRKANKREVLRSLDEALRSACTARSLGQVKERLAATRDRLNAASDIVHKSIGASGCTPFSVMGVQLKYQGTGVPLLNEPLDHCANWNVEQIAHAGQATNEAVRRVAKPATSHCAVLGSARPWGRRAPSMWNACVKSSNEAERLSTS